MEYYEGKTLQAYLEEVPGGKMEPEAATEVMLRVLDGLKEVHSERYLHRDVKPENVYLTKDGRPILIDFGAAREALGERSQSLSVVMTPGYAPYEQYSRKGNQGPHTDIYGAGATLYRMVTGQKPEPATDRVIEDTLQPPHEVNSEVPEGLSRAVMGALAMGDQERTSDAGALQRALRREGFPPKSKKDVPPVFKADGGGGSSNGEVGEKGEDIDESDSSESEHFAGFWKRAFSIAFDSCLLIIVGLVVGIMVVILLEGGGGGGGVPPEILIGLGILIGWLLYSAGFESSDSQATPGKMAYGIKVTDLQGEQIGFWKATGRQLGKTVSTVILLVGFIMAGFTEKKQALHDQMAGCLVVNDD
jgi:serine/threonine protein kinase